MDGTQSEIDTTQLTYTPNMNVNFEHKLYAYPEFL